ncbi:septal ring lytic transglycosylase RlpA family protein [Sphaerisporangium krabiense]|uniref:Probable endolytic peptidoglycan transglycosylase RlpA n=1 Tax=Sphaerisporangium krabiense TaxID=763782 RepID=A0A7W8Z9P0_9ACTN|nr:septal ring lytic transglycosylase RlpA family protein [Sphaerisporangium krabiense]MBB5630031.1 rare lipoprotein A [Sphaerisporangium krabiense]
MGQHSAPARRHDFDTPSEPDGGARRRWGTVIAATAVVATASAGAWVALGDDSAGPAAGAVTARQTTIASVTGPSATDGTLAVTWPLDAASPHTSPGEGVLAPTPVPTPPGDTPAGPSSAGEASPSPDRTKAAEPVGRISKSKNSSEASSAPTQKSAGPQKASTGAGTKKTKKAKKPARKVIASGRCGASYYDEGQMTASGERFNPNAMTAAHKTLPMGSKVRVTNPGSGASVTVRINDRGPYIGGRCLDLSRAAFDAIGSLSAGTMTVKYQVLAR